MASTSLRRTDLTVFVFVLAAMLSGMWLVDQFGMEWSPTFVVVTVAAAAGWTAYHRYRVEPHLGPDDDGSVPDDAGPAAPTAADSDDDRRRDPEGDPGARE